MSRQHLPQRSPANQPRPRKGVAKVTLSFPEWKNANIEPAIVKIPVNPPAVK